MIQAYIAIEFPELGLLAGINQGAPKIIKILYEPLQKSQFLAKKRGSRRRLGKSSIPAPLSPPRPPGGRVFFYHRLVFLSPVIKKTPGLEVESFILFAEPL